MECSLAFFDKVVDIWYKYLSELNQSSNIRLGRRGLSHIIPYIMFVIVIVFVILSDGIAEVPVTARGNDLIRTDEQVILAAALECQLKLKSL